MPDRDVGAWEDVGHEMLREQHERDLIQVSEAHEARRKAEAEVERLREALTNVRDELSNGPTANWDFIDRQWAVLDA
jgi:serine phosphatase RsbU (regulator of sigma subunit)